MEVERDWVLANTGRRETYLAARETADWDDHPGGCVVSVALCGGYC